MKIVLIIDGGARIILDCKTTTIERIKYLASVHNVDDVEYIK